MKKLALTFALAFAVLGGAVTISTFTSTPVAACGHNDGC